MARKSLCFALLTASVVPCHAQPRNLTAADYTRAEKFMNSNPTGLMSRASVDPNWTSEDRWMWYRETTPEGSQFLLVDPARGTREPAFDHSRLAAALSKAANGS